MKQFSKLMKRRIKNLQRELKLHEDIVVLHVAIQLRHGGGRGHAWQANDEQGLSKNYDGAEVLPWFGGLAWVTLQWRCGHATVCSVSIIIVLVLCNQTFKR